MYSRVLGQLLELISPYQLGITLKLANGDGNKDYLEVAVIVYKLLSDGKVAEIGRETFHIDLNLI